MLGQFKTAAKSNEITAIPELIDALQVQGATLSIDAARYRHAVVEAIVAKQADYIIAVKNNQPTLAQGHREVVRRQRPRRARGDAGPGRGSGSGSGQGHGRVETRQCVLALDLSALGKVTQGRKTGKQEHRDGRLAAAGEPNNPLQVVRLFTPDAHAIWLLTSLDLADGDTACGLIGLGISMPELGTVKLL